MAVLNKEPPVTNPYLRKKVVQLAAPPTKHTNGAAPPSMAKTGVNRSINNAVTPLKTTASSNQPMARPQKQHVVKQSQANASSAIPKTSNPRGNQSVTPTPKKLNTDGRDVSTATKQPLSINLAVKNAPSKPAASAIKSVSVNPPAKATRPLPKSKPTTLKSQLKSQIAALKNQKKQRLLQKEQEKQLAIREAERKKKEEEMLRLQKIKEQEKRERERKRAAEEEVKRGKAIRREVGGCLLQMVKGVEGRIHWESRRGVPYQVGEAVQYLVTQVERQNRMNCVAGGQMVVAPWKPVAIHSTSAYPHGNRSYQWNHHAMYSQPIVPTSSMQPVVKSQKPEQPKPLILHPDPMDKYSPFRDTYQLLDTIVCMTKNVSGSFGVTLRFECRSALVPREDDAVDSKKQIVVKTEGSVIGVTNATVVKEDNTMHSSEAKLSLAISSSHASSAVVSPSSDVTTLAANDVKARRKRRRRVNYGALFVTDASKATFVLASNEGNQEMNSVPTLKPGDIIVAINGRSVGGLTFSEACKAVSATSVENKETGIIRCTLKVARVVQNKLVSTPSSLIQSKHPLLVTNGTIVQTSALFVPQKTIPTTIASPPLPLVPFVVIGDKVSGEFTAAEWQSLVRSMSSVRRELSTGMALLPVSQRDVLNYVMKKDDLRKILQQRNIEIVESKLAYEAKRIETEMKRLAEEHWALAWKLEVERDADNENNVLFAEPLTDAKRSTLRSLARPSNGCRCGSAGHEFVNDSKCVLYRDVKSFAGTTDFDDTNGSAEKSIRASQKARNAMEAAYIDRFVKLKAETEATKREAEFVLDMELKQANDLGKAVMSPTSLCTLVLSAVASTMDENVPDEEQGLPGSALASMKVNCEDEGKHTTEEDSSDDEEDLPLHALVGSKRSSATADDSSSKRPKIDNTSETPNTKSAPSAYALAKILKHISKTYGHLFIEPSHVEYAWQQRHRSVFTNPLPREVVFKGNPREPSKHSYECIQFILDEERMTRLEAKSASQLNDEWIVAYLSSDKVTGLCHEIDVLESMGLLDINAAGHIKLARGWHKKVPHMMLLEMRDVWGVEKDVHNLHCIHNKIRSLGQHWECIDGEGWRSTDDTVEYGDEEYDLRKQIFSENFSTWMNEGVGVASFGC